MIMETYATSVNAMIALGGLMLVQLLVADVVGIQNKHAPGSSVEADHSNLLFRVTRTVANTNERIAVFIILLLACFFSGANAGYTAIAAWVFVAARLGYMVCYYGNLQLLRSTVFGVALLSVLALLLIALFT